MRACLFPLALWLLLAAVGRAAPEAPDAAEIEKWIGRLGDDDPARRQEAGKRLEEIGEPAVPALRKTLKGHGDPDVRLRAAVLLRTIEQGFYAELRTFGTPRPYWVNRVAFTRDGKHLVATGGGVIFYEVESGKEVGRVHEVDFARRGLALSADGKYFLTGHQREKVVRLGEVVTGKDVRMFEGHTTGVFGVALSADGTRAASGGDDRTLRLWDLSMSSKDRQAGKELRQFPGVTDQVRSVAFSPDGKTLAAGTGVTGAPLVQLWDVESGKELYSIKGHTAEVTQVVFLPDGKSLLSASLDGTLRLWEVSSGKELRKLEHTGGVYDAAVSPDGRRALSAGYGDHTVRLWELATGRELYRFDGHTTRVLGVAFSPDGKLAVSSDALATIRLWRVAR
jgi:WD40 repeat protein